jgi:hypothetical protein
VSVTNAVVKEAVDSSVKENDGEKEINLFK